MMKYYSRSSLCLTLLLFSTNAFNQVIVARYPFDNNASDVSGNDNNGRIIGGVESTSDRFGNPCGALFFNGIDGYIEVPNSSTIQSPSTVLSVTSWFKIENSPLTPDKRWLTLICKGNVTLESQYNPQYRLQALQTLNQSTVSINSDFTEFDKDFQKHLFAYGKWNFYAMVYDGNFVKIYLNSTEIWRFPYQKSFSVNELPLHIAKDIPGSTEYFCGALDDLNIYNTALTEREIINLYNDKTGANFKNDFILECPPNQVTSTGKNDCFATVNYTKPLLTIGCGDAELKQIGGLPSGSQFTLGTSTVAYKAVGNNSFKTACDFKIIVEDKYPPVFLCPLDTTITVDDGNRNKIFDFQLPSAKDNCGLKDVKLVEGIESGATFPLGKTILKFRATDNSGNYSECSYNVIFKGSDTIQKKIEPPVVEVSKIGNDTINLEHAIDFNDCTITAVIYDDGEEDNDTVSLYYNNSLIVDRQMIKLKTHETIIKVLLLNPNEENILVSKAWNTGLYGPNTLKIEFYEGNLQRDIKQFKKKKPNAVKVLHSRPGLAGAIQLKCNL